MMEMVKLGEVCKIKNGFAFKSSEFSSSGTPLLRISNFDNGEVFIDDKTVFVDSDYLKTKTDFIVERGDILIALSGATTGKFGVYNLDYPSLLNQRIGLLKSGKSETMSSKYFYYYLGVLKQEILRKAGGAAQPNISTKAISDFLIPLPPLAEQKRIASILDEADKVRQLNKKLIDKYNALTQSLFMDMFGDPVINPMGWEISSLKEITSKIGSGSTPRGGKESYRSEGISLIRSMNIYDNMFKYKNLAHIGVEQADKLKNVIVEENDVLFNITGASICRCSVVPSDVLPARVNQHVSILRPIPEILAPLFLSHLLISENSKIKLLGVGSAGGAIMEAITKETLKKFKIILPPIHIQNEFASRIEEIEKQKTQAQKSLKKSDDLFKALLQKAFMGEV